MVWLALMLAAVMVAMTVVVWDIAMASKLVAPMVGLWIAVRVRMKDLLVSRLDW